MTDNSSTAAQAAQHATSTIPVAAVNTSYPVETGLVASLARPDANVTGFSGIAPGLRAKQLESLRDMVPGLVRTVIFIVPTSPGDLLSWDELRRAAEAAGVQAERVDVQSVGDLEGVFELPALRWSSGVVSSRCCRPVPARTCAARGAGTAAPPAGYRDDAYAEVGLLMNYGPNFPALDRRGAVYVDKILKGAKPAELPVQNPTAYDFAVNLKTAQALALTIPPDVAVQVKPWIQ